MLAEDKQPVLASVSSEDMGKEETDLKFTELPPPYSEVSLNNVPKQISEESTDLPELKIYRRRWYILLLFCLLACQQCLVWNTFGPIESGAIFAYSWSASTAPMFANWGTIMFCVTVIPLSKLVEYDIRTTVLLVTGLMTLGTILRCCRLITKNPTIFLASCHICAILNGISGVTIMAAPPLISSQWFPPSERTTATSINQASNMLGNGLAMFVGPALVNIKQNSSMTQEDVREDIDTYMQVDAGVASLIFVLFCVYFPSSPPHPPAPSSAIQRTDFKSGLKALLTNRDILLLCFAYSISQGVMGSWLSVMVNNFSPLGISDQQIGYMGLASVLAQCVLSMVFGFVTDRLRKNIKTTILVLLTIATCGFIWLMLMCLEAIPYSLYTLYTAVILATSFNFSTIPLFFEMCVEIAYPVNEGMVGGFLTAVYNFVGIIFLFLFFVPNIGYIWINYLLVGSTIISIPAVLMAREQYNRSNVDDAALRPSTA